jgi:hypothetical protein
VAFQDSFIELLASNDDSLQLVLDAITTDRSPASDAALARLQQLQHQPDLNRGVVYACLLQFVRSRVAHLTTAAGDSRVPESPASSRHGGGHAPDVHGLPNTPTAGTSARAERHVSACKQSMHHGHMSWAMLHMLTSLHLTSPNMQMKKLTMGSLHCRMHAGCHCSSHAAQKRQPCGRCSSHGSTCRSTTLHASPRSHGHVHPRSQSLLQPDTKPNSASKGFTRLCMAGFGHSLLIQCPHASIQQQGHAQRGSAAGRCMAARAWRDAAGRGHQQPGRGRRTQECRRGRHVDAS